MPKANTINPLNEFHKQDKKPLYEGREGLAYVRVSDKKQELQGSGRTSQNTRCIQELASLKVPHVKSFFETKSAGGDFMNRPAMREVIAYIKVNPHKRYVLVFDDLKRFARDREFHFALRRTFKSLDVVLRCLNYNFDDSPEGTFAETIFAAQGQLEREQNRRQVIQKQHARLLAGYWGFVPKRGYTLRKVEGQERVCIPSKTARIHLKYALEAFANGTFVHKVDACSYLVKNGFWKNQSPQKYIHYFTSILSDPFYAGFIEYPKWDVARRLGKHKGIISPEIFERNLQRIHKMDSGQRVRVDVSPDFPLRGLILCDECGGHITAAWSKGRNKLFGYYFCQQKGCPSYRKSIARERIEREFKSLLTSHQLKKETAEVLQSAFQIAWKAEVEQKQKDLENSAERKIALEKKITELTDLMIAAQSETLKRTYQKQIEISAKELESIDQENKDIDIPKLDIPYRTAFEKAGQLLTDPYSIWEKLPVWEQRDLFYFLFDEKLSYSENSGYRTTELPMISKLFEEFSQPQSLGCALRENKLNRLIEYLTRFWSYYQSVLQPKGILQ